VGEGGGGGTFQEIRKTPDLHAIGGGQKVMRVRILPASVRLNPDVLGILEGNSVPGVGMCMGPFWGYLDPRCLLSLLVGGQGYYRGGSKKI